MRHRPKRCHTARASKMAILLALMVTLLSAYGVGAASSRNAASMPTYGGTVAIAFSSNLVTFDPAQAYTNDWQVLNGALFNGLYQLDRNGVPQLDLAAAPPGINADRTVWTFTLRKGVLFHNGMELTADDVKYSITRALDPHLKPAPSWGQTTDNIFQGSQAFIAGKAPSISGIQVIDRYTIRFVLARPVAVFRSILAESFNFVVPRAVVTHESQDYFASHPVGTGPFMLQSWQKGTKAVFVRNPHYFHAGEPYLDKVIVYENVPTNLIALKIEKGEIQGFGTASDLAASDLQQARNDPRYASYLVTAPTTWVTWLDLDVHVAPLTALAVRQAVAMAIDRQRLVELLGGDAIPAYQMYIPLDPQYDLTLVQRPVYPYNPQKAEQLLKASGYHGQPVTALFSNDLPYMVSMAPGIQQDLRQIGLNVSVRGLADNALIAARGSLTGHQLSTAYWGIDFPDAFDIYTGQMSCVANAAGGYAGPHYCDPSADHLVSEAESLPLGTERNILLREAQIRILRAAPSVPLVYLKNVEMVSPKVGGFYYQPTFGWQFENYWLRH